MAKLQASLIWPGFAQGKYTVKAKNCFLAVLNWGNAAGPLPNWGPFGYVPVDPAGNGSFFFPGMRSIPFDATHIWAKCIGHDFATFEDISEPIPEKMRLVAADEFASRFSILTDLHLSSKPFRIRQALQATKNDVVLLLGDSANDGLQEQFEALETCIDDLIPGKVILPVIGNHDILHSRKADGDGCRNYATFQTRSLQNAEKRGMSFERDPDSLAWATTIGTLDVIGLQCVISERRFLFPERKQLEWLENRLTAHRDSAWHLILCHAPLISHNPLRSDGQPYLDKDRQLQALIDRIGHCIFLSGHTHISPNTMKSSAEWDGLRNNLYLNCGSVVDTTTEHDESLMSRDWKDGCVTEITLSSDIIEIVTKSIRTGIYFPRGYYRFTMTDNAE